MLAISKFALLSESNLTAASLGIVEDIDQLPVVPPSPYFNTYSGVNGTPITGLLPAGLTRVRVSLRLDHSAHVEPTLYPTHYEMTLTGTGSPLTVRGTVNGEWPT
jgi:hypothetical protein